jgi:hypothetical protein
VATLFAAFLGYNPIQTLLGPAIDHVSGAQRHVLLGHSFFPSVISHPFSSALASAFIFGLIACLIAAAASAIPDRGVPFIVRGRRRVVEEPRETLPVIPAGATLEFASADIGEPAERD